MFLNSLKGKTVLGYPIRSCCLEEFLEIQPFYHGRQAECSGILRFYHGRQAEFPGIQRFYHCRREEFLGIQRFYRRLQAESPGREAFPGAGNGQKKKKVIQPKEKPGKNGKIVLIFIL